MANLAANGFWFCAQTISTFGNIKTGRKDTESNGDTSLLGYWYVQVRKQTDNRLCKKTHIEHWVESHREKNKQQKMRHPKDIMFDTINTWPRHTDTHTPHRHQCEHFTSNLCVRIVFPSSELVKCRKCWQDKRSNFKKIITIGLQVKWPHLNLFSLFCPNFGQVDMIEIDCYTLN